MQILVIKREILIDYSNSMMDLIDEERKHALNVLEQTVKHCKSLAEQIERPFRRSEEIRLMENSMETIIKELTK